MNGLKDVLKVIMWACIGVSIILTGGVVLVIGILAGIGKVAWAFFNGKAIEK